MRSSLLVALLAILAHAPSLGGAFVYDDVTLVQKDPRVQQNDVVGALTQPYWGKERQGGLYRPVTTASFVVQGLVSKGPLAFRLANLALHAAASVLALALARRITGSERAAFLAAALFAVHPIHVEVAANVVGRAESLGFLLAGTAWLLAVPAAERSDLRVLALASLLALLGILSKENALAVALGAPLEAFIFRRRRALVTAVPAIVGLVVAFLLRRAVLGPLLRPEDALIDASIMNPLAAEPLATRLANVPLLLLVYLEHLGFPNALAPDYGGTFLQLVRPFEPRFLVLALGVGSVLALPPFASGRRGAFASCFFLLALAPVLQAVPIGTILADRLAYAASFGFALGVVSLFPSRRFPPRWLAAPVLGLLAFVAMNDARAWTDGVTLFRRALKRAPGSIMTPYVLGQLLAEKTPLTPDEADEARALFVRLMAELPDDPRPVLHLAFLEHKLGFLANARTHLEKGLILRPREEAKARAEYAFVLLEQGDLARGESELQLASELGDDSHVLATLGFLRERRGDLAGARAAYEKSLAIDPNQEKAAEIRRRLESLRKD
jgi:tetratricopeptide (TPR) repeat protein